MTIISVSVPSELKEKMQALDEVNWSGVARKAFENEVHDRILFKEIVNKSKLTEKDVESMSKDIKRNMTKKFTDTYGSRR